ncbi:hypothetical protein [Oxalobacter paraformigenes]|uniref:hypothetical protein n=1 Tax=Oxalobacter paraformigenes TaxID=556268 RepID=UPI0002F206ED|nr:hypothetical protein [Oxalobacter paraformigenes]
MAKINVPLTCKQIDNANPEEKNGFGRSRKSLYAFTVACMAICQKTTSTKL